ncbi:MAG: glycosyltransferase family 39 protein, partial [Bacteroidota bacterium]|nr:glycosyltransferase family 39 protein [Bacteroidota bacterium]
MLEFKLRSVNLLFVVALIFLSFLIAKTQLPQRDALISSFIFAFSPLIIFSQSLRISIDPFFAVLLVSLFYGNYYWFKKSKTLKLFIFGYFIAAIAFLTKAYPAIYFQFISLISLSLVFNKIKLLFSWKHLLGITVFGVIIGTYVLLYQSINNDSFWLFELFNDVNYKLDIGLHNKTENLLTFFGKSMLAYPILFLFPLLFLKKIRYQLIRNKFDFYSILLFIGGCLPFLTGDYYPQYILMLIPFITIPLIRHHRLIYDFTIKHKLRMIALSLVLLLLATLVNQANFLVFGLLSAFLMIIFTCIILFERKAFLIIISSMILFLMVRQIIIFTPLLKDKDEYANIKDSSKRIIEIIGEKHVFLYPDKQEINYASMFYLSYYHQDIIPIENELNKEDQYYLSTKNSIPKSAIIFDSIAQKSHYKHPDPYGQYTLNNVLYLFQFNDRQQKAINSK